MDEAPRPTIKGIFVKAHIRGLERERGREGVLELHQRFGRPINYHNTDNVPIKDEVELLEHIVDILSPRQLSKTDREIEAGRLHFKNFATTPLWGIVDSLLGSNPRLLLLQAAKIAGYVFQDVQFISEDLGERSVRITMFNNDYPVEHFQGFFQAWLFASGLVGSVDAKADGRTRYEYTISWNEPA